MDGSSNRGWTPSAEPIHLLPERLVETSRDLPIQCLTDNRFTVPSPAELNESGQDQGCAACSFVVLGSVLVPHKFRSTHSMQSSYYTWLPIHRSILTSSAARQTANALHTTPTSTPPFTLSRFHVVARRCFHQVALTRSAVYTQKRKQSPACLVAADLCSCMDLCLRPLGLGIPGLVIEFRSTRLLH